MLEQTEKTKKTSLSLICFPSYFRNGHLPDTSEKLYNVSHHVPMFTKCDLANGVPSGQVDIPDKDVCVGTRRKRARLRRRQIIANISGAHSAE